MNKRDDLEFWILAMITVNVVDGGCIFSLIYTNMIAPFDLWFYVVMMINFLAILIDLNIYIIRELKNILRSED